MKSLVCIVYNEKEMVFKIQKWSYVNVCKVFEKAYICTGFAFYIVI